MIVDPHIEQADFSSLREYILGQTYTNHYFVAHVPTFSLVPERARECGRRDIADLYQAAAP